MEPTVLLLYGPPCSVRLIKRRKNKYQGKTRLFDDRLSKTIRLTPSELFKKEENVSFHSINKKLAKDLKNVFPIVMWLTLKGQMVAIDDSKLCGLERSRQSLSDALAKEDCKCKIISVIPKGGQTQCLWANEFALAGTNF